MPFPNPDEPLVPRVEMALMQYAILDKARRHEVTREELARLFRRGLPMTRDHLDHCVDQLVKEGRLREVDPETYAATDTGRDDAALLEPLVKGVPDALAEDAQQERPPRARSTGGTTTGTTLGNQGDFGTSRPSGVGVGQEQPQTRDRATKSPRR